MKCPKCGYVSFDFNEICPKCQRSIIPEREKMHHLPFRPEPPFLLGALLTKTGDSQVGVELSEAAIAAGTQEHMLPLDEGTVPAFQDMDLEESPLQKDAAEPEGPSLIEEEPLAIEDLDFDEEAAGEDELVEVSTGTGEPEEFIGSESSPLDEEALSLELEDLLDADKRSELMEEREPDEEALTIEMEAVETVAAETPAELHAPPEVEEPEELFDSFDTGEPGPVEEETEREEDVFSEPAAPPPEPSFGEPDELFSPDDLKGYKIGQYDILTQPPPLRDREEPGVPSAPGAKTPETREVWDEISKDLQDLDFDIDEA